tara:strand:+ start:572 stop:796 length:225 start_codon:yes stop_codon:yes gene_type:complete
MKVDTDSNVLEATAILLQVSRRICAEHDESAINNNANLRKTLTKKILEESKSVSPEIDADTWAKASQELLKRSS